jgi:hypothetical protein
VPILLVPPWRSLHTPLRHQPGAQRRMLEARVAGRKQHPVAIGEDDRGPEPASWRAAGAISMSAKETSSRLCPCAP